MSIKYGGKGSGLLRLREAGFCVPDFLVFTPDELRVFSGVELAQKARDGLKCERYAVRSSSFIEDGLLESHAGEFETVLDVAPRDLEGAIAQVLDDARSRLGGLDQFACVVQKFINADVSGVLFTRDPRGTRASLLEYVTGRGDVLVSGQKTPKRFGCFRTQQNWNEHEHADVIEKGFEIESFLGAPQDIEWCKKNGVVFFLQARPITTRTVEQNDMSVFLDEVLPRRDFFYEKTMVTEVAPEPSEFTWDLLQKIYIQGGPVDRAYARCGILYNDTGQLVRVGGQLYVDREQELRSLFPAMTHMRDKNYRATIGFFSGVRTTWRNQRAIRRLTGDADVLLKEMQGLIHDFYAEADLDKAVQVFLDQYEVIFRSNLIGAKMIDRLGSQLPKGESLVSVLSKHVRLPHEWVLEPPRELRGNSLEVYDNSDFCAATVAGGEPAGSDVVLNLHKWQQLREYGRWLMLQHVNVLRALAGGMGRKRQVYGADLPRTLQGRFVQRRVGKNFGVSAGTVTGRVVMLSEHADASESVILFVEDLSPDIVDSFESVVGVIAKQGGLLSHAAIVAREMHIPIVVCLQAEKYVQKKITLNGETGDITI